MPVPFLDSVSILLYAAIALLSFGFWVWMAGVYALGWPRPGEFMD
ncbi:MULTISPECIES: hypothetical protein [Haloferax]|nr:hypothetical protein [Haloferax mediterranei]MDX5988615.1 hypothetical protein [Haloferax mediterranei ATCC 33500]